ncbi:MAG: SNF2-related protein [Defluviitaleaceae bacterium]|nr:SNF2-related protein [Defluviitaleaceae bacterium]MCL2275011.1 SNF2-related protein [Defluviitaleaceae bacterium]
MRLDEKLKVIYETIAPTITRSEEAWKSYLRFGSAVYKHPFDNALLVYAQNPKATMLADFNTWTGAKVGRSINRGEKGIAVCEYNNANLNIRHLFDVSQTNGKKSPAVWQIDDTVKAGLVKRLSQSRGIQAENFIDCIHHVVANHIAENIDTHLQGFDNDVKGHFLGEIPREGLMSELLETIHNSCVYYIAHRCGETADVAMPTISHFDSVSLVARLGFAVTELSKGILLEIERNVKILAIERSTENEQRINREQGTPSPNQQLRHRERPTPRQVRTHGNEAPARNRPPKVFTFEDAGRPYVPNVSSGRGSNGAGGRDNAENVGNRPNAENRRPAGKSTTLEQTQGHGGRNSDTRDGANPPIAESTPQPEPKSQPPPEPPPSSPERKIEPKGSFFMPAEDDKSIITADLLRGSMVQDGKTRIYNFVKTNPTNKAFADFLKNEYGWGGHSGNADKVRGVNYNNAGISFRLYDESAENGEREIKLKWSAVAKRITALVNSGEYLPNKQAEQPTPSAIPEPAPTGTPLWQQYTAISKQYPNGIVFKRLGDFYEVLGDNAKIVSDELDIALTSRDVGLSERIPMSGVPAHAVDSYIARLVKKGYTVVLADGLTTQTHIPETETVKSHEEEADISTAHNVTHLIGSGSKNPPAQMTILDVEAQPAPVVKKQTGKSIIHHNYKMFETLFPQITEGTYSYLRLESEGFEPLSIEWLGGNQYSMMHTFTQNSDLMRDPDMVLDINPAKQTIQALSYELSSMGVYQEVYANEKANVRLQRELNNFLTTWLKNISEQDYVPVRAISRANSAGGEITFDGEGNSPLRLNQEMLNAHHGQLDMQMQAFMGNVRAGVLNYCVFESIPHIQHIEVAEDYRRQGIATAMVRHLAREYPDIEIEWGILTEDGEAFHNAITYTVENEEYTQITARLEAVTAQLAEYEANFNTHLDSPNDVSEDWNAAQDEKYNLEKRLADLKPVKKFIRLDNENSHHTQNDITHTQVSTDDINGMSDTQPPADGSGGLIEPPADTPAVQLRPQYPTPVAPTKTNYRYAEEDNLYAGGAKSKFRSNIEAIRLVKHLENEKRLATSDEQKILAKYVGWGGLANAFSKTAKGWENEYQELKLILDEDEYTAAMNSTITAFYTEPKIAKHMYTALQNFGFEGGANRTLVEPALGTGNFFSVLPEQLQGTKLHGVELDSITGRIAKQLYQNADVQIMGFETTRFADDSVDVIVGNIPFNNIKLYDRRYTNENFFIHDYFIAKSIDLLKPGGIAAVITSKGTMDKIDISAREYFARRADLIGAIRLPNHAFKALSGTEVTADILFFQKLDHVRTDDEVDLPDWVYATHHETLHSRINQYFIDHPEMILGEMQRNYSMYGNQDGTACVAPEGQDLYAELTRAINNLSATFTALPAPEITTLHVENENAPDEEKIKADAGTKNYTYVVKDDNIFFCEGGYLIPQAFSKAKAARTKGLCEIRTALLDVIAIQSREYDPAELTTAQQKLNTVYDAFVEKHGYINDKPNRLLFNNDDQYPLLRSIEDENSDKVTYRKAPIFTKATIKSYRQPTTAATAKEALEISLNMKLKVDLSYMAYLYGKSKDSIIEELGDRVYLNPQNYYGNPHEGWETAEEYLSGDVVSKLEYAQLKATDNELFTRNVTALQEIQPAKLLPSDIDFRIGSPWIPVEYYRQFMYETFETPASLRPTEYGNASRIALAYMEYTDAWHISNKKVKQESVKVFQTYGTKRANAYEIYEDCLNMQAVTIRDPVKYTDASGREQTKYIVNANETMIARSKQQQMKEAFGTWLFADKDRAKTLLRIYNERFNRIRPREYDGSHLYFDGMSEERTLRPYQKNVVARILYHGTCLMAHEVGAGKTASMITAGMYMKNMGVIKKPMYVVPNHLIEQWANEFLRFFPSANILVTTKADFEKKNRNKFVSRIAMGAHDAIIIGHSQFEKIPVSQERQANLLQQEINSLTFIIDKMKLEKGEKWAVKQIVIFQNNLKARLESLIKSERKDDLLNFEQLGVDYLFVDEAHAYKNAYTYSKLRNVAGIGQSKSQRAADMLMKCQYLQEINNGRGITFATGTPLSNSMSEMYVMQRFLQPDILKKTGLHFFDKWAATFGDIISSLEINPEGSGYRIKNRFSKFHNLPELMKLFRTVTDIQTADMLNLPVPEINGGKAQVVVTQRSPFQTEIMMGFVERAEAIRNRDVDPEDDNFLKLTNEAKLMAIDPRLVYADAPNDYDSKLNTCIRNVHSIWQETADQRLAQVIFCDSGTPKPGQFNVYDEVRERLIEMGVPAEEIAFVHDAKNDAQREEMFEKTRTGEIRVLLGSTAKLGTGTNIQNKLYALHHLDVPWRPSDIIQRDGRGLRFGNENDAIHIFRYVTQDTFDAYLWQIQEQKLRYITQIMTSKSVSRSCEDTDETVLTAAEIKAIATSNPLLAEKMTVDNEVTRLKLLKGNWTNEHLTLKQNAETRYPEEIAKNEAKIENITRDVAVLDKHKGGIFMMEIDGKTYDDRTLAGDALLTVIRAKCEAGDGQHLIGSYRGLGLYAERNFYDELHLRLMGSARYSTVGSESPIGCITRIDNLAERIPTYLPETKATLAEIRRQLDVALEAANKPFEYEEKLSEYLTRQSEINTALEFKELSKQQDVFLKDENENTNEANEDVMEDEIENEDEELAA